MSLSLNSSMGQAQKMMVFVLSMSIYGIATLFTELIPSFHVGIVEFSVEYFLYSSDVGNAFKPSFSGSWCGDRRTCV